MYRKRPFVLSLILVVILTLLWGCASEPEETTLSTEPAPTETIQQTTETTPEQTHSPTEPPIEETEPPMDSGPVIYVEGTRIEDTLRHEDVVYVKAADFCLALDGSYSDDGTASLEYRGATFGFSPAFSHMLYEKKALVLKDPVVNYQDNAYVPLAELCQMLELSVYQDPDYDGVYCTAAAWPREVPAGYDVPIFMYHAVSNDLWGIASLFVKPERMEEQLKYLTENGYDTIFFEDLYHIGDYDKPVILTFDDGYEDNYTELFPLLQKYNAKATVFVITGSVGTDHYLSSEQIEEMANSGLVSIQSHTVSHPDLDTLSLEDQREELEKSKAQIARLSKREPYVLCYPTGKYNSNTLKIIGESYQFGIKMKGNLCTTGGSPFELNRYYISRNTSTSAFRGILEDVF
jgi:hypothetical protein